MSLYDPARDSEEFWANPLDPRRDEPTYFLEDLRPLERLAELAQRPDSSSAAQARRVARDQGIDHRVGGGWRLT